MNLHLLRHAKTDQFSATGRDFDRALLPKGIGQCALLVDFFQTVHGIEAIWCSSSQRTRQTYEGIAASLNAPIQYSENLYLCSAQTMLQMLWNTNTKGDLLIIGHNYGISDLAEYFSGEPIELRTGGYVCISFEAHSWKETSRETGTITRQYRPKVSA